MMLLQASPPAPNAHNNTLALNLLIGVCRALGEGFLDPSQRAFLALHVRPMSIFIASRGPSYHAFQLVIEHLQKCVRLNASLPIS